MTGGLEVSMMIANGCSRCTAAGAAELDAVISAASAVDEVVRQQLSSDGGG